VTGATAAGSTLTGAAVRASCTAKEATTKAPRKPADTVMGLRLEAEAATFCIINPTDLDSIWIKTNRVMSWLKKSDHRYRFIPGF
jgi:hypothetical protein